MNKTQIVFILLMLTALVGCESAIKGIDEFRDSPDTLKRERLIQIPYQKAFQCLDGKINTWTGYTVNAKWSNSTYVDPRMIRMTLAQHTDYYWAVVDMEYIAAGSTKLTWWFQPDFERRSSAEQSMMLSLQNCKN